MTMRVDQLHITLSSVRAKSLVVTIIVRKRGPCVRTTMLSHCAGFNTILAMVAVTRCLRDIVDPDSN